MGLTEVHDMSWAEFQLRSFGFWKKREYEMKMVREISYEVHTLRYLFGKKNPPSKWKFWNIGKEEKSSSSITQEMKDAYMMALDEYKSKN